MKPKKCKICGEVFIPTRKIQPCCSYDCSIKYAVRYTLKRREKLQREQRKETKIAKEKLKTLADYKKDLQVIVNRIARIIDEHENCISCGAYSGKFAGSHYHSVGSTPALRFNLHNIHKACYRCNEILSGNISGYDVGLIDRYGDEYWNFIKFELPKEYPVKRFTIADIKDAIKRAKIAEYGLQNDVYNQDGNFLRKVINNKIGLYE